MSVSMQALGIDRLPVAERIALAQEIWDSVAAEVPPSLSEAQRAELRRRLAEDNANPDDTVSWDEALAAALRAAKA